MEKCVRRDSHMKNIKNKTKILIAAILLLAISIGLTSIVRAKREEMETRFIVELSADAEYYFSELLSQLEQDNTDYEMSYRQAMCSFYALYRGVRLLSDTHNHDLL